MRAELEIFVNDNYSIEKQGLIRRSFSIFDDYNLEDYDTPFMELISEFDSRDYSEIVFDFETLIKNSLISLTREQGVILNEEASLEITIDICSGLLDIQFYDDKETILRTIETDYSDEEKLAKLLNLVTLTTVSNFLVNIDEVDNNIFTLISSTCDNTDSETIEPIENTKAEQAIVSNLRLFREYSKFPEAIGFKIIEKGFRVKLSFDIYSRYLKSMVTDFSDTGYVAKEYFVILLMASESYLNPINFFRKISNILIDDITLLTKVDMEICRLYNEFEKFKARYLNNQSTESIDDNQPKFYGNDTSELPNISFDGLTTGYEITFKYDNKTYTVKNTKVGLRGKNIPCIVTKKPEGYFIMEVKNA